MISEEVYKELRSTLDDVAGVPWDECSDLEYINAIKLLVDRYEKAEAAQYREDGENL